MTNSESFIKQTAEYLVSAGLCSEENSEAYAREIYYNAAECFVSDYEDDE